MAGWQKKRSIKHRYDATASMYDMRYAEEQTAKINAALKHLKKEQYGLVLDVGCGTGILFDCITDNADAVVGLDFSSKSLLEAKRRSRAKNAANVHLVRADADNMPFGNDVLSHVFAMTIVQNAPNPTGTLTEIRRVADDHAVLVITGLKKIFNKRAFQQLLRNARLKVVGFEDGNLKCYVAVCAKSLSTSQLARDKGQNHTKPKRKL